MARHSDIYAAAAEAPVVALARTGDGEAFAELVRRRQSWIRNLMRRLCGDATLADDLAQQVFLQAWRGIGRLRRTDHFGGWLKRLAVNTWLQHARRHDALRDADRLEDREPARPGGLGGGLGGGMGVAADLDSALAALPAPERLCIVLGYHDGLTHGEIADLTDLPPGTVKSHIRRGTRRLRGLLAAYGPPDRSEETDR